MISEKNFAKSYTSFWVEHTPWLSDYYLTKDALGKRKVKLIDLPENPDHVGINNIIATTHFKNISSDPEYDIELSYKESIAVIEVFGKKKRETYSFTDDYRQIVTIQAERLSGLYAGNLIHDPAFPGCGLMTDCKGDLLYGTTLVEIKAYREFKRKPFHPEDFKQLLIYCALNFLAGNIYPIEKIQLFNPRMGYLWQSDLEEFVFLISNSTSAVLFENIGNYLTELSESIGHSSSFSDINF
jgi:hypothetical protein